jgi:hypothetical protein
MLAGAAQQGVATGAQAQLLGQAGARLATDQQAQNL